MGKFVMLVVAGLLSMASCFAYAGENSGFYAGGDIGAGAVTLNSFAGSVGSSNVTYGAIAGYRVNNYLAVEGDYLAVIRSRSNANMVVQSADSTGKLVSLLLYPSGESLYLKAGYGTAQTQIGGTVTTLLSSGLSSSFITTNYSETHDSTATVFGIGRELRGEGRGWSLRTGLDYYSLKSTKGGNENVLDLNLALLFGF